MGRIYLVADSTWGSLPAEVRKATVQRIGSLFVFDRTQVMTVVTTVPGAIPEQINFIAAVIRPYPNRSESGPVGVGIPFSCLQSDRA